ncbi:glycerophosphodiester phosphodiesterase [Haladaptatus sp. DYF46]|uniref:glycerophosphodiester phosphodiesterase n=1 Tax=Haladaptatus sp. DYF46 TaxID=2886041 RepID=UPI001E41044F|nr:glycerophosphodiester phosphodiesterase [Haladaptatus sp. DYF46]
MKIIGHRGFANSFPENTEIAFQNVPKDADMVELDLRRCRSGEIVVIHDGIVDAVTDSDGQVADYSATELANLNVHGSGQGVPTLANVLEIISPGVSLNLEIKELGLAEDVVNAVRDWDSQVVISSANKEILQEVRGVDPNIPIALIFAINPEKNLRAAEKLGCTHVQPHWGISLSTSLIEQAHEKEMKIFVWTINTDVGAQICRKLGADGVIADRLVYVDQLASPPSQGRTIFDQPSLRKVGVLLLPIALRGVTYPFVLLGAFISVIAGNLGTISINSSSNSRAGYFFTWTNSTLEQKISILLWKGKSLATASDGRWRGASFLNSVRRFKSSLDWQGIASNQYTESESATKGNKLWNRARNSILLVSELVTDRLHDVSLSRIIATGYWGRGWEK